METKKRFRTEIEGLRAVAALLVAIYHIWLGNVSGGVDVFFVVSGFLITTSLLGRVERTGKVNFYHFILGLMKRLFPAAFFVLAVITIACIFWLPQVRWEQTLSEIIASAFYYQNWQLAFNAVDYLAQNNEASPVQHFWAMSIQGQFYILWPTIVIGLAFLVQRFWKKSFRSSLSVTLIAVFLVSLAYSIHRTSYDQAWAYFDTFTRVWEFSLGGIVAVLGSHVVLRKSISFVIGWIGLLAIVLCGIILQVSTVFPGYAALWPTLAGVFIILAGPYGGTFGVHRLLSIKPLQKLGGLSYALYLWHWPILVFYFIFTGKNTVPLVDGMLILLASIGLSYVTTNYVEKPIRTLKFTGPKWKVPSAVAACMIPVVLLLGVWSSMINQSKAEMEYVMENEDYIGAMAYISNEEEVSNAADVPIVPTPAQARGDLPKVYGDKCHQTESDSEVIACEYGVLDNSEYTLALVGGSHSAHWLPALEKIAEKESLKIINYTKSACRFSANDSEEITKPCQEWNNELIDILLNTNPDIVFTTSDSGQDVRKKKEQIIPKGFIEQWEALNEADIPVFAIRDNAWFEFDVPSCVEENGADSLKCAVERDKVLPEPSPWSKLENPPDNVYYADLNDYICDEDYCRPVVGNVLVYRDKHHLTSTYSKTLAPVLQKELFKALSNK